MLVIISASWVFSANEIGEVSVRVEYVDLLDAPTSAELTLTQDVAGETTYDTASLVQADALRYCHNSSNSKKITATALPTSGGGSDITLRLAVEGSDEVILVDGGDTLVDVPVWTDIPAGGYTMDLLWKADGTLAETTAGANIGKKYEWQVMFTSSDN